MPQRDWTPEERAAIEAKYKANFSAADLQQYTEELDGVPFAEVIEQLENRQRELAGKEHDRR